MSTVAKSKLYTFEEFCAVIDDGQKADLIDGVIYMASPDNTEVNSLSVWLSGLLSLYLEERDLGKIYVSRVAFRLSDYHGPEPDIAFIKKSRLELVQRGYVDGPPDLAIEIVSPDSIERDYRKKRQQYEEAGVPEYWIIDELEESVTHLRLTRDGKYRETHRCRGALRSKTIKAFWIQIEWLWQRPLPRTLQVLAEILGKQPGK